MIIPGLILGIIASILLYISFQIDFKSKSKLFNLIFIVLSMAVIFFCYQYVWNNLDIEGEKQPNQEQTKKEIKNAKEYHGLVVDHAAGKDSYILFIKADGKTKGYEVTKQKFIKYPINEKVKIEVYQDNLKSITSDSNSRE